MWLKRVTSRAEETSRTLCAMTTSDPATLKRWKYFANISSLLNWKANLRRKSPFHFNYMLHSGGWGNPEFPRKHFSLFARGGRSKSAKQNPTWSPPSCNCISSPLRRSYYNWCAWLLRQRTGHTSISDVHEIQNQAWYIGFSTLPLKSWTNSGPFLTHFGDDGLWRDFQEAVVGNGRPELSKVILIHWKLPNFFQPHTSYPQKCKLSGRRLGYRLSQMWGQFFLSKLYARSAS